MTPPTMTQRAFTYEAVPGRVVFGSGSRHGLAAELDRLAAERVLVIASPYEATIADELTTIADGRVVGRFSEVVQHVPESNAAAAVAAAMELQADAVLTVGGGSATGLGKVIRLDVELGFVAVPTTYAGSEMTTIWGRTDGARKMTGRDPRVKPDTVIYDPELTSTLPAAVAGPSGMNALAHCVEALYGPGANPVIDLIALAGIRAITDALPGVCGEGDDLQARTELLYGAYLAGVALASGGTALHHKTCHVLGGMFDLDHGGMNAVVLGHALAYNAPAIPDVMERLGDALGVAATDVPAAFSRLGRSIGAPASLEALGMPVGGIEEAAVRVAEEAAANVRPPDEATVRQMLDDAFHGRTPT